MDFHRTFLGNTLADYLWMIGLILAAIIFKQFLANRLSAFLFTFFKKYSHGVAGERFVQLLSKPVKLLILVLAVYFAFDRLAFPVEWKLVPAHQFGLRMILMRAFQALLLISLTWVVLRVIDFLGLILSHKASQTDGRADDQLVPFLKEGLKIIVGVMALFVILGTVFKLNIASLIAGLGIGGLAVALAAKETLENLMGSFTIFVDQPFVVGDYVKVGNVSGTVEKIGFRSTRIRTVEKSFVTVPNKKMVDAETENLSLRTSRRAEFTFPLTYNTSTAQLEKIISGIRALITSHPLVDQSDVSIRFNTFATYGLEIKVEFYFLTTNNAEFLTLKETIGLGIMQIVEQNGSAFATPIQKIADSAAKSL